MWALLPRAVTLLVFPDLALNCVMLHVIIFACRIPYPPTREVYVFNRYGQHTATKDLTSGKTRYSFLYSKNTSFGKLSTVTDSSGNKILFLRDYSNVVSITYMLTEYLYKTWIFEIISSKIFEFRKRNHMVIFTLPTCSWGYNNKRLTNKIYTMYF